MSLFKIRGFFVTSPALDDHLPAASCYMPKISEWQ